MFYIVFWLIDANKLYLLYFMCIYIYIYIYTYMIYINRFLRRFFYTLQGHGDNFLQTFTWHGVFFSMFTVWHGLFSLVLLFPGLRIEAPPLSTVQGKCIYTIFKAEIQEIQFLYYVLNMVQINVSFCHSKVVSPGSDLSACHPQHELLIRPIYRPTMPQQSNRAARFIDQMCQLDKIFRPINQPTASKWLNIVVNIFSSFANLVVLSFHRETSTNARVCISGGFIQ